MDGLRGSSPTKNAAAANTESPEQLLDVFKAAALSVTKLYKTSAAAQTKARSDGYQDCLDDLLAFLDKRNIGLNDGEGWQIRRWATERLDGRDGSLQSMESEDEADKTETASSPEVHRASSVTPMVSSRNDTHMRTDSTPLSGPPASQPTMLRTDSAPPLPPPTSHATTISAIAEESQPMTVPTQETFNFTTSQPMPSYPHESSYLNIANLDLSDSTRPTEGSSQNPSTISISHTSRSRSNKRGSRPRASNHLGRGAGQKRPINLAELFDVGSINFGKDVFGRDGKRSRHS